MVFWKPSRQIERPTGGSVLQVYSVGPNRIDIEFFRDKHQAYYLEKPEEDCSSWNFELHRGSARYYVNDDSPCYSIQRNQTDFWTEIVSCEGKSPTVLYWRGEDEGCGLAAKNRAHYFRTEAGEFEWSDFGQVMRTDLVCKNTETKQTVAYFRCVLNPPHKLGKLEMHSEVDEELEELLVATFVAFREWRIRRQVCMTSDNWFDPSVDRNSITV